jgi:hypothetical protein
MTANDFFLLFVAFGGFLIAPALLVWGILRLTHGRPRAPLGPDSRPDKGSLDGSIGAGRTERPDESPELSRRTAAWRECPVIA